MSFLQILSEQPSWAPPAKPSNFTSLSSAPERVPFLQGRASPRPPLYRALGPEGARSAQSPGFYDVRLG
eukprot:8914293-Alexandrium_andersonii.AAC.1